MREFKVVPDSRRRPQRYAAPDAVPSPLLEALRAGKTVVADMTDGQIGGKRQLLRKSGLRLVTRREPDGLLLWCEPLA